ncbi:HNH endonuclease [Arthrobacter sp. Z1-9]
MALSDLLNRSHFHPLTLRDDKFRNPAGVARKTWDIATQHPEYTGKKTKGNRLDAVVLNDFLLAPGNMQAVAAEIQAEMLRDNAAAPDEDDLDGDIEVPEGRLLLARHLKRERNRGLRARKIQSVKKAGLPVACEICSFNFQNTYGQRGQDYIEVHHVLPLHASGPTSTRLSDLALLCANCHRMIHRGSPWLTPKELEALVSQSVQLLDLHR